VAVTLEQDRRVRKRFRKSYRIFFFGRDEVADHALLGRLPGRVSRRISDHDVNFVTIRG
jgi:hypothetical protein